MKMRFTFTMPRHTYYCVCVSVCCETQSQDACGVRRFACAHTQCTAVAAALGGTFMWAHVRRQHVGPPHTYTTTTTAACYHGDASRGTCKLCATIILRNSLQWRLRVRRSARVRGRRVLDRPCAHVCACLRVVAHASSTGRASWQLFATARLGWFYWILLRCIIRSIGMTQIRSSHATAHRKCKHTAHHTHTHHTTL